MTMNIDDMLAHTAVETRMARLGITNTDASARRLKLLTLAHVLVDDALFTELVRARRLSPKDTITLPPHRFEGLSRGRGWARKGRGENAVWGERKNTGGYRVGPGKWSVGATDGFTRKGSDEWVVKHVTVGTEIWTVAS